VSDSRPNKGEILIVDDQPANLRVLTSILTQQGYRAQPVDCGELALQIARKTPPDLILLDILMPEMDGYEVCRRLKADQGTRDIPIIFISALGEIGDKVRAFAAGGVDYVTKPFQLEEVLARVETHVALRTMQKQLEEKNVQLEHEIAERVRAEKALREERDTAQRYLDVAGVILVALDANQQVTLINKRGCELLGYGEDEIIGKNWFDAFIPLRIRDEVKAIFSESMAGRFELVEYFENPVLTRNGQERLIAWHNTALRDEPGHIIGTLSSGDDITQRKQAEEALRASEERWRSLAEDSPDHVIMLDANLNIEFVNHASPGLRVEELIGTPLYTYVVKERQSEIKELLEKVLRTGQPTRYETEYTASDGTAIHYESRAVPRKLRGEVVGLTVHSRDISELKWVEERLQSHAAELEQRNEDLDAFSHTVAHDLQQPLGVIVGFADTLQEDCSTISRERMGEYLRIIARNGRKMSNIINELLLLAGVHTMEVEMQPIDMARIVAEARQRLAYMIEEYQAEIVVPPKKVWPMALGHAPWIEEVWVNYLSNAIKYGGWPPRVELGAVEQGDGIVRFWVRDNGSGLTPEEQTRLFTPLTRLDRVRAKGHGLGLSIVRRIVERLGGQAGVESEVGQGSLFFFTLPACTDDREAGYPAL
jgi:PAS domain S-box-containing protein